MTTEIIASSSMSMRNATLNQGKYLRLQPIGNGIFGNTYRAIESKSQQEVILKTTAPCLRQHDNFTQFKQQILKRACRLLDCKHPHLTEVIDCFEDGGQPYIVYKFIQGKSLAHLINSGFLLRQDKAVQYIQQIGSALMALHSNRLLHQDVKPANIILHQNTEQAILTDFSFTSNLTLGIKQTHANLVSPGYAAPEQYELAGKSTPATDVYGLAATLYYLLTGTTPLPAPLQKVIPPGEWRRLPVKASPELKMAILLGLSTDLSKRPTTVGDWLNLIPQSTFTPANSSQNRTWVESSPKANHRASGDNCGKKHQSHLSYVLSESADTTLPPLPLESGHPVPQILHFEEPTVNHDSPVVEKPSPSPPVTPVALDSEENQASQPPSPSTQKKFPLSALLITSLVAASAGIGFGLALRFNQDRSGSTLLHQKQSFPPLPNMPRQSNPDDNL